MRAVLIALLLAVAASAGEPAPPHHLALLNAFSLSEKLDMLWKSDLLGVKWETPDDAKRPVMLLDRLCRRLKSQFDATKRHYEAAADNPATPGFAAAALRAEAVFMKTAHANFRRTAVAALRDAERLVPEGSDGPRYIPAHARLALEALDGIRPDELVAAAERITAKAGPAAKTGAAAKRP